MTSLQVLTPDMAEELRRQGFIIEGNQSLSAHPLYQTGVWGNSPLIAILDNGLGETIAQSFAQLEIPIKLLSPDSPLGNETQAVVIPLSLDEKHLQTWSVIAAERSLSIIAYLATPTRLLLATIRPFHTPCLMCLVRRLRANYRAQDIADLPLERLFGAASHATWPTDALAVASIVHSTLIDTLPQKQGALSQTQLLEFHYAQFELRKHPLLWLPNCPVCSAMVTQSSRTLFPLLNKDERWTDPKDSWDRMQVCISPLIGIVESVVVENELEGEGKIIQASTTGQTHAMRNELLNSSEQT